MADLGWGAGLLDERAGNVLEQAHQVQFLLVMPTQRVARLLAADCEDGHVVHACVIQAGDQVRRPRARRRDTHSQLAGELGMGAGHERGHFFVTGLDEPDLALGPIQGPEYTVDAVARIAVDATYAPFIKALNQKITDGHAHVCSSS